MRPLRRVPEALWEPEVNHKGPSLSLHGGEFLFCVVGNLRQRRNKN